MSHSYTYDPLYRLSTASGTYKGADNKTASYTLAMGYDNMHRITSKKQHLTQSNVQFNGSLNAGYDLTYTYNNDEDKKFQLASVRDINYRTNINNGHKYSYDANGNLVYINTSRVKRDGKEDDRVSEQKYKWDEENRLLAADENYSFKRKKGKLACTMPSAANRRVKLNAKELDEEIGMYYYGARYYEPRLSLWMSCDLMETKYPGESSYTLTHNNPINLLDIKGDSIAVLRINSEHLALLIQNKENKWEYYSVNGDNVYVSGKHSGGRTFDDLGEHKFDSPQQFLESKYNREGDKNDKSIANYEFTSAYVIPTTKKQDDIIRKEFVNISKEEYSLNPLKPNHCGTAVQRSLQKAKIDTKETKIIPATSQFSPPIYKREDPYFPSSAYKAIKRNNPKGYEIRKRK